MALTNVAIRNAKARAKAYKLTDAHGLYILITTGGSKLWRMKFRYGGSEQMLSFGPYPEVTLVEAREKRDAARRQIRDGKNPSLEKRRAAVQAKVAAGITFAVVAEEVIAKREREGLAPATAVKLRWYASLLGRISARPVGQIEAFELLEPLRKIETSGRYETALATLAFAGRVFRYAVATGRAQRDVAADLRGALTTPKTKHHAAIIEEEGAGRIMRSIQAYKGQGVTRLALAMMAHTFPRPGELRHAEWREFDLEAATWRIPAARTKMRKEHLIPLSRQALSLLGEAQAMTGREGLAFRSYRNPRKPLSENTLNVALRGMGFGADEMTSHGFRAMASTLLNESGKWNPDAIERALAHGDSDTVRGAYHRGLHWAERVEMMQWWSDHLEELRDEAQAPRVKRPASGSHEAVRRP